MAAATDQYVLAINGGSSSIRFAVYRIEIEPIRILGGKIERIGSPEQHLVFHDVRGKDQRTQRVDMPTAGSAAVFLLDWLERRLDFNTVRAVGHRVVHGLQHVESQTVTPELLRDLHGIVALDWDHLPREIELIEEFRRRYPQLLQVACFDTAFHRTLPRLAQLLPIPRRFDALGIRRYGFHGLSYAYLMQCLTQINPQRAQGRVILAHMGNGVSMAAVKGGASIDTSMGFTPTGGLLMGTRSGDFDPGLMCYLMQSEGLSLEQFSHLINHESGLLGVSESSADMRDLLEREMEDVRAVEAVALFCYQARKWIGAYAAVLNGIDTLVFSGGIGENQPLVRARICDELAFLGIVLDAECNAASEGLISVPASRVEVRVIATDEEWMVATTTWLLAGKQQGASA
ncbi:MAG TPA: acetate/propionate family kinase [Burkholderiaceae bacterium]|nr:acetate/propionate family kinase [Burkholderiaceae bacterium]